MIGEYKHNPRYTKTVSIKKVIQSTKVRKFNIKPIKTPVLCKTIIKPN